MFTPRDSVVNAYGDEEESSTPLPVVGLQFLSSSALRPGGMFSSRLIETLVLAIFSAL